VATESHDVYVIELSSFQLDNMYDFKANVAVILNITPDHLDRYDYKMENYVAAKFRIMQNQTSDDAFIYWHDDPVVTAQLKHVTSEARMLPFSALDEEDCAACLDESGLMKFNVGGRHWEMPRAQLSLKGLHNVYNSMAAGISATFLNVNDEVIRRALADFEAVEHRLEYVRTVGGVTYINDSKATNVDACWYALESMKTPTILIIGGKDKGNDYTPIMDLVKKKCAGIVYLGADNTKLHENFDGLGIPVRDTHSMKDCVAACYEMAEPGMTVLLSPCCASFDLFKNMEDRGEQFKQLVRSL
jgi:UDP-N-acetylmuramoylalanine--D-glutamate ligase